MTATYPPWIFAYLSHAIGPADAAKCVPTGRVTRCPRHGSGTCGRLGYWFRDESVAEFEDRNGGAPLERLLVVWDGKTVGASTSAIEYGMVDPGLPYGIDLGVYRREAESFFSCGWCGHPDRPGAPPPPPRPKPVPRRPEPPPKRAAPEPAFSVDEARREELERWAEKLETVNPEMARKVRDLMSLIPPPGGAR